MGNPAEERPGTQRNQECQAPGLSQALNAVGIATQVTAITSAPHSVVEQNTSNDPSIKVDGLLGTAGACLFLRWRIHLYRSWDTGIYRSRIIRHPHHIQCR